MRVLPTVEQTRPLRGLLTRGRWAAARLGEAVLYEEPSTCPWPVPPNGSPLANWPPKFPNVGSSASSAGEVAGVTNSKRLANASGTKGQRDNPHPYAPGRVDLAPTLIGWAATMQRLSRIGAETGAKAQGAALVGNVPCGQLRRGPRRAGRQDERPRICQPPACPATDSAPRVDGGRGFGERLLSARCSSSQRSR